MPIYEYKCNKCSYRSEKLLSILGHKEISDTNCAVCEGGVMKPVIALIANTPKRWGENLK